MDVNEEKIFHDEVYRDRGIKGNKIAQVLRAPFYRLLSESIGKYETIVTDASKSSSAVLELGGGGCVYYATSP